MARSHGHEVTVCDALHLPYRDQCFDAVVSVGVIHHLTTTRRRAAALQEACRVLRPGGKAMICVWAMEQKHRKVLLFKITSFKYLIVLPDNVGFFQKIFIE